MKQNSISPNAASAIIRLGRDVQTARRKRRLRQKDLAAKMRVSVGTLQRLESGDPGVSLGVIAMAFLVLGCLHRFAEALDVASDDVGLLHDQAALPKRVRKRGSKRKATEEFQPVDRGQGVWL